MVFVDLIKAKPASPAADFRRRLALVVAIGSF
jgi:hypothetical protein